jgi:predicted CDP-diglyceride synthetase/phosphatidate cytidylyltransferase
MNERDLLIRIALTLIAAPLMGWVLMRCAEEFEKYWKTNNRKKRWLVCCALFILLAAIGGWVR